MEPRCVEYEIGPGRVIRLCKSGDIFTATARIITPYDKEPILFTATASQKVVQGYYDRLRASMGPIWVGSFFDDVGKVMKSGTFQTVMKGADAVMKSPLFGAAMSVVPGGAMIGPALQLGVSATTAVSQARGGDPKAKQRIKNTIAKAKGGDKGAKLAVKMMDRAARLKDPGKVAKALPAFQKSVSQEPFALALPGYPQPDDHRLAQSVQDAQGFTAPWVEETEGEGDDLWAAAGAILGTTKAIVKAPPGFNPNPPVGYQSPGGVARPGPNLAPIVAMMRREMQGKKAPRLLAFRYG